jgi:hypothetical protein
MANANLFCPLYGLCEKTSEAITAESSCVPLATDLIAALSTELSSKGEGAFTRLVLTNGIRHEEVTVTLSSGKLTMSRPANAAAWPACSKIMFEPATAATIQDLMCQTADAENESTPVPKIPGYTFSGYDDDGNPCFEQDPEVCSWRSKTHELTWNGTSISKEPLQATELLQDGVYENATITVKDGCITAIVKGTSPLGCNTDCGACGTEADPTTAGVAA